MKTPDQMGVGVPKTPEEERTKSMKELLEESSHLRYMIERLSHEQTSAEEHGEHDNYEYITKLSERLKKESEEVYSKLQNTISGQK